MTKRWPVGMTAAFLLVFIASFLTWGTIRHHYTSSFMLLMEHPGLANRIISEDDLSNLFQLNFKNTTTGAISTYKSPGDEYGKNSAFQPTRSGAVETAKRRSSSKSA
jgi:hypothetical protein